MNKNMRLRLATVELRSQCELLPFWTRGISGAEGEGTGGTGSGGDGGTGGDNNGTGTGDTETPREKALREEKDRHFTKAQKAAQDLAEKELKLKEATDKLEEIENKDKSEVERATKAAAKAEKELADAKAADESSKKMIKDLQIKVAFLQSTKYTWHDPETALLLVGNYGELTIGDDGKVAGLEKAVDALAKDKAFLVKTGSGEGGNGGGATGQQNNGGTGRGTNGQMNKETENKLRQAYNIPR